MDFRGTKSTIGIRNNNPGNIIKSGNNWKGKVHGNVPGRFEQFVSIEYGIRAMMRNIVSQFRKGHNSIAALINKWAPAFENKTGVYISFVSNQTGIAPHTRIGQLNKEILIALCKAIAQMENAPDHRRIPNSSYEKAFSMIGYDITQFRFAVPEKKNPNKFPSLNPVTKPILNLQPNQKLMLIAGGVAVVALSVYLMTRRPTYEYIKAI